jgi:hypothetical protein
MNRQPRGIRNNNPGNLKYNPRIRYQGLADPPYDTGGFFVFLTAVDGLRALMRDLLVGYLRGEETVYAIIHQFAPTSENDTASYIRSVCLALTQALKYEVRPDDALNIDSAAVIIPFARAIVRHENGRDPYTYADYLAAARRAGVADAGQAPLRQDGAFIGASAGSIGGGLALLQDQLAPIVGFHPLLEKLFVLAVIGGLGWALWSLYSRNKRGLV